MPAPTSRPSSPFPPGWLAPSCPALRGEPAQFQIGGPARHAVGFLKDGDEHGRDILQEIFGLHAVEQFGVLLQLVRDLVNDEAAAGRERVMSFSQERAFLV